MDQVIRLKLDYGSMVLWQTQESGPVVFDVQNGQVKSFSGIESDSVEMDPNRNAFSQFFGKKMLYGILIEVTPIKPLERDHGVSTYIGYILGRNTATPNIDAARAMDTAFQLPVYGSEPLRKFYRLKDLNWIDARDEFGGYFFVVANANGIRGEMPQWEARLSLYVKYKCNAL